jgi:hypothetical protein
MLQELDQPFDAKARLPPDRWHLLNAPKLEILERDAALPDRPSCGGNETARDNPTCAADRMSKDTSTRKRKRAASSAEAWALAQVSQRSRFGDDLWQLDIATAGAVPVRTN